MSARISSAEQTENNLAENQVLSGADDDSLSQLKIAYPQKRFAAELIRKICVEEGADAAGFVDVGRHALAEEKKNILYVYSGTRTVISLVSVMNRENIQSPARYVANDEFHRTSDDIT